MVWWIHKITFVKSWLQIMDGKFALTEADSSLFRHELFMAFMANKWHLYETFEIRDASTLQLGVRMW